MESTRSNLTIQHVIHSYVEPARKRGDKTIQVRVGNVQKELGWTNRTPSIFSTLGSRKFQHEAGLQLIDKRDGPPSGGPSTTVQFVYRLVETSSAAGVQERVVPNGAGLLDLCGILSDAFRQLGGGEAYLKQEREELRFPAEEYPHINPEKQN